MFVESEKVCTFAQIKKNSSEKTHMMNKRQILSLVLFGAMAQGTWAQLERSDDFRAKYELKEVVVMSRHNIRSPL